MTLLKVIFRNRRRFLSTSRRHIRQSSTTLISCALANRLLMQTSPEAHLYFAFTEKLKATSSPEVIGLDFFKNVTQAYLERKQLLSWFAITYLYIFEISAIDVQCSISGGASRS